MIKKFVSTKRIIVFGIFLLFATVFSLISLVNHYYFRTAALDLGMFNHALYNFAHFSTNYFTLELTGTEVNFFGCHFSPITLLYIPFYYLFGSYTLLIIQIAAILFGAWGIYKYSVLYFNHGYIPILILLHFFGIWAIYFALSFDFHNSVVAAMIVPWLVYFYEKRQYKKFLLCFFLILIAKENMSLWLAFILMGLMLKQKEFNLLKYLKFEVPLIIFSLIYFFIVIGFIMPYYNGGDGLGQLTWYANLGNSLPEILMRFIKDPIYCASLFFNSHFGPEVEGVQYIKKELHLMVLASGGFALLHRPYFLFMLLPIYAQKLLSEKIYFWSINQHYSIEFVPILSLCLVVFLAHKHIVKWKYPVIIATILITYYSTYDAIKFENELWHDKSKIDFLSVSHYKSPVELDKVYDAMKLIPENEAISVSTNLAPHLAFRDKIYHFPIIKDANYVMVFKSKKGFYPIREDLFLEKIESLIRSGEFETTYDEFDVLILERKI